MARPLNLRIGVNLRNSPSKELEILIEDNGIGLNLKGQSGVNRGVWLCTARWCVKIYFSHGKKSSPWGTKVQGTATLAKAIGWQLTSVDYRASTNPNERVQMLLDIQPSGEPLVLVGSSMGGYVSTVVAQTQHPAGLFLLAPAFFLPDYAVQNFKPRARQ